MPIKIIGGGSYNNGGDGIRVEGNLDLHLENFDTVGNGGHGVNIVTVSQSGLDEETKTLLLELKNALDSKDKSVAKKVLATLTDKSLDLVVALVAGKFFQ